MTCSGAAAPTRADQRRGGPLVAVALASVLVGAAACTARAAPSEGTATGTPATSAAPSAPRTAVATTTATDRSERPTPTPIASPRPPEPTPVVLTVGGHVTMASDGRPVPGTRLRIAPFAISGGTAPKAPGPDVTVTSDARGAYSATVSVWTLEALADSSSSQLSLFVTPPAGMQVASVTQSITFPIGPIAPNDPQWYFMLARELRGPIDIALSPQ